MYFLIVYLIGFLCIWVSAIMIYIQHCIQPNKITKYFLGDDMSEVKIFFKCISLLSFTWPILLIGLIFLLCTILFMILQNDDGNSEN